MGVVVALALGGLVWWALTPAVPDPIYKGKPLSYWFRQLPATTVYIPTNGLANMSRIVRGGTNQNSVSIHYSSLNVGPFPSLTMQTSLPTASSVFAHRNSLYRGLPAAVESEKDTIVAVREMGTNALPFVMLKLRTRDSAFKREVPQWAQKIGIKGMLFENPDYERGRATSALLHVPLSPGVRQELLRLTTNADANLAYTAMYILSNNVPEGIVDFDKPQPNLPVQKY